MITKQDNIRNDLLCIFIETVLLSAIVLILSWSAYQRNLVWKDDLSLWSDNVKKSYSKARAHQYLGLAYHNAGYIDSAIKEYKISLSIFPFQADVHNNIGVSYFFKGDIDTAITHFKHALAINPSHSDAHYNLGIAYGEKGLTDLARKEILKGMKHR